MIRCVQGDADRRIPCSVFDPTSWRRLRGQGVLFLEFRVTEVPAAFVLSVKGEIDLATAPELTRELERLVQDGRDIVVDLSQVGFMDLRGVRIFETFHDGLRRQRQRLVLCAPSYSVHRILHLTEVHKVISMFPSIEAARNYLQSGVTDDLIGVHSFPPDRRVHPQDRKKTG